MRFSGPARFGQIAEPFVGGPGLFGARGVGAVACSEVRAAGAEAGVTSSRTLSQMVSAPSRNTPVELPIHDRTRHGSSSPDAIIAR
jgi:hypothetical protein